jgi:hypothetical protein
MRRNAEDISLVQPIDCALWRDAVHEKWKGFSDWPEYVGELADSRQRVRLGSTANPKIP